jgi:acyl-coenzyme A thioesterase PaaI-like protein
MELWIKSGPQNKIRFAWQRLQKLPLGHLVFSRFLGQWIPYTGTLDAKVVALTDGFAQVEMADKRRVRNHLNSIHAMALANLGELATGLALNYALPPRGKGILVGFEVQYLKKARGPILAQCEFSPPEWQPTQRLELEGVLTNASGEVVTRVNAVWKVDLP